MKLNTVLGRAKVFRFLKLIGINLLVLVILAEVGGLIVYAIQEGEVFYFRKDGESNKIKITMKVLHPYFGYSHQKHREDKTFFTNNHGFIMMKDRYPNGYDYPTRKDDDTIIVGVFGGSVANGFVWSMQKTGLLHYMLGLFPEYHNKKIEVLQFANGGYKQPQQLLLYSYFLSIGQEFDLVVNIDGFNEIYLTAVNAYDNVTYSMPVSFIYKRKAIDLLTGTNNVKRHVARSEIDNCFLSSCFLYKYLISLKRTWKPRSLSGEEKFSRPEAEPGCDTMGGCRLNELAMRFTTRNIIWYGHRNTGGGSFGRIFDDALRKCFVKLLRTLALSWSNWKWPKSTCTFF